MSTPGHLPPGFGGFSAPPSDNRDKWDIGNHLLSQVPANLSVSQVVLGGKQLMFMTVRTPSTTVTVLLEAADAKAWAKQMNDIASKMSSSGLIAAGGNGAGNVNDQLS